MVPIHTSETEINVNFVQILQWLLSLFNLITHVSLLEGETSNREYGTLPHYYNQTGGSVFFYESVLLPQQETITLFQDIVFTLKWETIVFFWDKMFTHNNMIFPKTSYLKITW